MLETNNLNLQAIMKESIVIPVIIFLFVTPLYAQNNRSVDKYRNQGFFNITRFSYINVHEAKLETYSAENGVVVTEMPLRKTIAYSLQTINGYFFSPYFSAGIGLGLDAYQNPHTNTLPLFFDLRTYFQDAKSSPYIYMDIGSLIPVKNGTKRGNMFNIGLGYKQPFLHKDRWIMVTDISYSYKAISNDGLSIRTSESWMMYKGVMLGIGIIF